MAVKLFVFVLVIAMVQVTSALMFSTRHANNTSPLLMAIYPELWTFQARLNENPGYLCSRNREAGPCKAAARMYFYNPVTKRCTRFTYGGCQGNQNNFNSYWDCMDTCRNAEISEDDLVNFVFGHYQRWNWRKKWSKLGTTTLPLPWLIWFSQNANKSALTHFFLCSFPIDFIDN